MRGNSDLVPTRGKDFYPGVFSIGWAINRLRTFWPFVGGARTVAPPVAASTTYSGATIDAETMLALSCAWACIWRYANTISTLPLFLQKIGPDNTGIPARDHPLYGILHDSPSKGVTAAAFWQAMIMAIQVWGNGYAVILRIGARVVGLKLLRPERMQPYLNAEGVLRYQYSPGGGLDPIDYAREDIFHLFDRTADGIVGLSRIQYARNSIGLALSAERAAGLGYRNGLRASGFIKIAQWLNKDKRDLYRAEVENFTSAPAEGGSGKQGGVMILENGMDFTPLSMSHADVEMLSSRKFSIEEVCRFWDMPPVLIGHSTEGQTMWGSGVEQIILGWQKLGLAPILRMIEQAISVQLLTPAEQAVYYAEFKLDGLLRGDPASRYTQYSTGVTNGLLTRNEVRGWENLPPIPGGDVATVQSALTPLLGLGQNTPAANALKSALLAFLDEQPTAPPSKESRP